MAAWKRVDSLATAASTATTGSGHSGDGGGRWSFAKMPPSPARFCHTALRIAELRVHRARPGAPKHPVDNDQLGVEPPTCAVVAFVTVEVRCVVARLRSTGRWYSSGTPANTPFIEIGNCSTI